MATAVTEPTAAAPVAELRSIHHRRPTGTSQDPGGGGWSGSFDIVVEWAQGKRFEQGTTIALWCTMLLEPTAETGARVVDRLAGHLVLEPTDPDAVAATGRWTMDGVRARFPARHANDGPESAYLILPSGETRRVRVRPATTRDRTERDAGDIIDNSNLVGADAPSTVSDPPLVPHPAELTWDGVGTHRRLHLAGPASTNPPIRAAWNAVRDLAARLGSTALASVGSADGLGIDVSLDADLDTDLGDHYRVTIDADRAALEAGSIVGVRHGLVTLAQWATTALPARATIVDGSRLGFRGVHLDLARRWYEPDVVERLIDLSAWRKLSHVHLHLTDDEAWRFPVAGYPSLTALAGTRGHGLSIPPLCASGPDPCGRAYTADEIGRWVERADDLGVTLVPEVDVPGHNHAALTAVPTLRDPDDTSTALSIQAYPNNVLVPGHPETEPFLRAVFSSLAALFPHSPVVHIGGDEVPDGAWAGSPIVQRYARERELDSTRAIEASFHNDLIDLIRSETGRDVAMWEEAALAGAQPSGYAVSWTAPATARRVAATGHRLVASPGQAYYLDMADDDRWESPGSAWAGIVPLAATCRYDPFDGLDDPGDLHGIQACIWGEHIVSVEVLDRLVFPRLDAVAERAWTGHIVGDAAGLVARAAGLPRFAT